jgi:hypothetical protein
MECYERFQNPKDENSQLGQKIEGFRAHSILICNSLLRSEFA